jgi:hypothetical protein
MIAKKTILFFILLIPFVSALEFSPASLQFSLEKNEISCKKINFEIESSAAVHDAWAQNNLEQWSVTNFKTSSDEHQIELSYPSKINSEEKEFQVCISGSKSGDYRGVLIFREEKIGNSIVQFAVWIRLHVNENSTENNPATPPEEDYSDNSGSAHKGSSNSQIIYSASQNSSETNNFQTLNFPINQEEIKLNSPQKEITTTSNKGLLVLTIPALIAVLLLILIVAKKRRS